MKKMLMLASVASMIDQFNMSNITLLQELGLEVHIACNFEIGNTCPDKQIQKLKDRLQKQGCYCHQVDISRHITDIKAFIKAYKQVGRILQEHKFEFIHCHSPIGGVIGRITGKKAGIKVIYTAHGFHFHKGAPLKNWLIYYPVEKICSLMTDVLITINKEDYELAQRKMKAKKTEYVPGVGIDLNKYQRQPQDESFRESIRKETGCSPEDILLLSVGELNANKNHETVIRALAMINNNSIHYAIAGQGVLKDFLLNLARELGIECQVHILGFREDIVNLYKAADLFVLPSKREGLSVALMEAMASGLPVVCSRIRGNIDLVDNDGGILFEPSEKKDIYIKLNIMLCKTYSEYKLMGGYNIEKIKLFSNDLVIKKTMSIYTNIMS